MRVRLKTIKKYETIKNHESELNKLNTSLKSIKRAIETLPKTNIDSLERIKLAEQEKKKKRKLWKKLSIFIVPILFTFLLYAFIYPTEEFPKNSNTIKGFIKYPLLLFPDEEESIDLTLINTSSKDKVDKIKFLLKCPREFIKIVSNDGSSITPFAALDMEESRSKTIKFQLNRPAWFKKIALILKLKINNTTVPDVEKSCSILLMPIPYVKSFILWFFIFWGTSFITPVVKKITSKLVEN
jgi:hypothetical protein